MYRYLLSIDAYGHKTPIKRSSLPDNPAVRKLAAGLAQAHKAYGNPIASILFIVQDSERNAFDQRSLEYHLLGDHAIQTARLTLPQIAKSAQVNKDRRLIVPKVTAEGETSEISVVYFRAGYGPADYPSKSEWNARKLLESSRAIKCPTIITQLAGCKKIQQVLATPGVLERYIPLQGY
jgi:glutathione synthetase